jgi:tetratricopeptide (TPR) repeat protein
MSHALSQRLSAIRRFVGFGPVLGGALALAAFAGGLTWGVPHPAAPWALQYADAALGAGRPDQAVQMYDGIAQAHPDPTVRTEARHRAALVYATQLMRPDEARRQLEALLAVTGAPGPRGDLLESIGELLLEEGQPEGAAARFQGAATANPAGPQAGERLLRAGRTLAASRRDKQAEAVLRRVVRDHPQLKGHAELARANLKLRRGKIEQALTRFEAAIGSTYDPDVLSVARLGRTTCLERLGDLDSALAELEEIDDIDDQIRGEREASLRSRRWSGPK